MQRGEQTGGVRSPCIVAELSSLGLQRYGGIALLTGALQLEERSFSERQGRKPKVRLYSCYTPTQKNCLKM